MNVKINNQCQGCQAGWPTVEHKPWPKWTPVMIFHIVKGGYKGERVMCTKDRYKQEGVTK